MPINTSSKSHPRPPSTPTREQSQATVAPAWPTPEAETRLEAAAATTARRLGLQRLEGGGLWTSQVLNVLGPNSFAEFPAVRAPGKVIWCNFELASQLGFNVPRTNQLTPEFHEQLLAALSFRVLASGVTTTEQEVITMYADRYGGDGVGPALGAGRAGFLSYGNLYVKGIGLTPLFKHDDPDDFAHSHGEVHLDDCLAEAIFGEVNENLFTQGSTRILAIIDQGKQVITPTGRRIAVALVARAGAQLRPAHLLGNVVRRRGYLLEQFLRMAQATGQLVTRADKPSDRPVPDVRATMLRIIDDHARTSAEAFRWRLIHGALSASNMEISGAMLDLPTQSTQPRTAPIRCLDYADSTFGTEHLERATRLATVYRTLLRNTPPLERDRCNVVSISCTVEMRAAYYRHLQVQLLRAAGLKTAVAQRIQREKPALASQFADLILQMVALKNPGTTRAWRSLVEHVSVLDVFHLLQQLPRPYFANPGADHTKTIQAALRPVYRGKRAQNQAVANTCIKEFAVLYRDLLTAAAEFANEYYGNVASMQASITARAEFENQPLETLYCRRLHQELKGSIAAYKSTGAAETISGAVDQRISASLRNVDGLLAQGQARLLSGGGSELQMRTIAGVNYSVRAWNDAAQTRALHVSIPIERSGSNYVSSLPQLPRLTKRQLHALRYRFTTDGGKNFAEVRAHPLRDEQLGLQIDFADILVFPRIGRLAGTFYLRGRGVRNHAKTNTLNFSEYTFAIPDRHELLNMLQLTGMRGGSETTTLASGTRTNHNETLS